MVKLNVASLVLSTVLLTGCVSQSTPIPSSIKPAPEAATGYTEKTGVVAKKYMIASANPLATDAGYQVLKAGGSAVDAAIAAQMVLTLVEPQSSGMGGGGFLMHFDGVRVSAYDGRETAPASATEKLFLDASGKPLTFREGVVGGRSVGVPGLLRLLELAYKQDGKLPWASLFAPAIRLADHGFAVSPRLARLLEGDPYLKRDPVAATYFYDKDGNPWRTGHLLKNPALAAVLREIASAGADAFYSGRVARNIVAKVQQHPTNPGGLTVADMAGYQAKVREPVCSDYRSWTVCGMPPPSSGGIAIAQMLGMLEARNMRMYAPQEGVLDARGVHLFAEAGRLAYADRSRYVADTDFVPLPGGSAKALLDKQYLTTRGALISEKSMGVAPSGLPPATLLARGTDTSLEFNSTSHISIIDTQGHAVSMTTSIEDQFGARQMVDGFLLNNQLTDFSFDAIDADGPIANRVQGGKRPRSAMSPTFVFEKNTHKLVLSVGSPGGSAIINYVGKVMVGIMDWGLDVQHAISLPNFGSRNGPTELEQGRTSDALIAALQAKGHTIRIMAQTSGLQGIMRMNVQGEDVWFGGADPRREGTVQGD